MGKKLLVIQVAGLSRPIELAGMALRPIQSVLPAVTCTVQASFRTASPPASHGMVANGLFCRSLARPMFWEQSARLVAGPRIWEDFRRRGRTVGMMFWQQSLGENVDLILSPAPIHKHHGGMIEACYCKPADLYNRLVAAVGEPFKLRHYWGPLASAKAGDWIADATAAVLADESLAPDLLLTYLPTLDYDLQRHSPDHRRCDKAAAALTRQLQCLLRAADRTGRDVLLFGDYCIAPVGGAVFPNRALLEAGLLTAREVGGMLYPDLFASQAFAMVDHEIAHVYIPDGRDIPVAAEVLQSLPGIADVLARGEQLSLGLAHANSGQLILLAEPGKWLAYPWWTDSRHAPDYAGHVDIHNKPGFDPCELFFGWPPGSVSTNAARVRGSHGRVGKGRDVLWGSSLSFAPDPADLIELARALGKWLNE